MSSQPNSGFTEVGLHLRRTLERIKGPTLILAGDSKVSPQPASMLPEERDYHQGIASPQVRFVFWEGVGHLMRGAKPDAYNALLEQWLAES